MTATGSLYPLDDDDAPIANYVQVSVGGHPCFAAEPPGAGLPAQADAVVVGAGYTGVSAALHLGYSAAPPGPTPPSYSSSKRAGSGVGRQARAAGTYAAYRCPTRPYCAIADAGSASA